MGIFTTAPGYTGAAPNAGVTLSGQTNLKIELGMAAEWFHQASNKALTVRTIGSQVYSNGCRRLLPDPGGEAGHADHGRPRPRTRLR